MSDQEKVDALTTAVGQIGTNLTAAIGVVQTELNELKAAHPAADFSKLEAAVNALTPEVEAVNALKPTD